MLRPQIVYWNNMPTPYVVGRFNAVALRGNISIEAWFNSERENDRNWDINPQDWRFRARYIPVVFFGGKQLQIPVAELKETRPDLLVSLLYTPSFVAGASAGRHLAQRTAFRVLPTFDSWVRRSKAKEATKQILFRAVDAVKVPGSSGANVALRYGVPASRISQVTQSIDVEHYATARNIEPAVREMERQQRGLHGCVFMYTGRLWSGKGIDTLIDAYILLIEQIKDVSLFIVGDGVDDKRYWKRAHSLPNVHFEGFVQPVNLPQIYSLADVFVFPTLGDPHGLVVEEAMAAGLPVISSEAAGDIRSRLPDGDAGFIVPPKDAEVLANRMKRLAQDRQLRHQMAKIGHDIALERSHEAYAIDFENFVEHTLRMPARTGSAVLSVRAAGAAIIRALPARPVAPLVSKKR